MEIYLHNTLTGTKEVFTPLQKKEMGMYNCGPTVYGPTHIGHARPYIFADTLHRVFTYNGYKVNQILNITDVGHLTDDGDDGDDKIEKGAREQKVSAKELIEKYTEDFFNTLDLLNIDRAQITFPRASQHIEEQIEMIKNLEAKGLVYRISDGMYFDTAKFPEYGRLGNINLEQLQEGARVEVNNEKKNHTDFALWKFPEQGEHRQQEWPSPWGTGFPGWHIECSAMSRKYLGDTFDIHTGGIDHIPTHHNNEIAQSESVTGKPQANYWLHVSHILIDNQKISKSLGNGLRLQDLEEKNISPLAYRYWILTADYRTLVNFTWTAVEASKKAYEKLVSTLARLPDNGTTHPRYQEKFLSYINDDINTAAAIALVWELLKDDSVSDEDKRATIFDFDRVLGFNLEALSTLAQQIQQDIPDHIQALVEDREQARKEGNFTKADAFRETIEEEGFEVRDGDDGPEIMKV